MAEVSTPMFFFRVRMALAAIVGFILFAGILVVFLPVLIILLAIPALVLLVLL